jgi:hypothetical protein
MWKKLDNFASSRTDADLNQASNSSELPDHPALDDPWLMGEQDAGKGLEANPEPQVVASKPESSKPQLEKTPPVTLGAYTEAVKKFTKSASAFIEQLPLLAAAREAYEEANRASAELRKVLDSGDENLRALMSHLEHMANIELVNAPAGRTTSSNVEPSKLGPVRVGDETKGTMKRFP